MSNIVISPQSGVIEFNTGNAGSSSFMTSTAPIRLDATGGNVWFTGSNVGIGITNPSIKLEVNSAGTDEVARFQSTDNDSYISISDNTDAVYIGHDAALDVMSLGFNNSMGVSSNLNIDTNGSVGIGTNNPAHQLHLNKEDAIAEMQISRGGSNPSTDTDIGRIQFKTDYSASPNEVGSIWVRTNSSAYRTDMRFGVKATAGSEEVGLTIHGTNDGPLVGIGTTNPEDLLTVSAGAGGSTTDLINVGGTGNGRILVRHIDGKDSVSAAIGPLFLNYGISQNVSLAYGGGNVGIGSTSNPQALLHVHKSNTAGPTIELSNSEYRAYINSWGSTASAGRRDRFEINASATDFAVAGDSIRFQIGTAGDSYEKMRIASDGNVGIGTTAPTTTLQVVGTISGATISGVSGQFSEGLFISGAPVLTGENNPAEADTLATVTARGNTTTTSIVSTGPHISGTTGLFGQGTFTRADIGSVDIFGDAIYVGEVRTNSLSDKASNGNAQINFGGSSKTIEFETDATARMFIAANGNVGVGIGSNAANQKFTVGARSNFDSQNNYYGSWVDGNTAGDSFFAVGQWHNVGGRMQAGSNNMYIHTHNTSHDLVLQSGGGYVGIETNTPAKQLQLGGSNPWIRLQEDDSGGEKRLDLFVSTSTGVIGANQSAQTMMFQTVGESRMTIEPGGNVGVGTTNPANLLHVDGKSKLGTNGFSEGGLLINYASLSETKGGAATLLGNAVYAGTTNNTFRRTKGDAGNYILMTYNRGIAFHTNVTGNTSDDYSIDNHEQMRITTGGFVGIGTSDPLGTTHIYTADAGGAIVTNASHDDLIIENNGNCGIQLSSPASSYQYLAFGDTASANAGYVRYYHSDDSMVLRAGADDTVTIKGGDVRIGTNTNFPAGTVAGGKLDVRGDSDGQLLFDTDGGSSDIKSSYNLELWADYDNNNSAGYSNIYFKTDGDNTRMTIDNNGKVGIGNSQPSDTLQVAGQVRIDGSTTDGLTVTSNSGASRGFEIYNNSSTDTASLINYYDGPVLFGQNNAEKFRINTDGDLVIAGNGTSNDSFYLYFNNAACGVRRKTNDLILGGYEAIRFRVSNTIVGNQTERMCILDDGNVGIGTTTPYGQVDIFSSNNTETDPDDAANYHLHLHNPLDDTSESIGIGFGLTSAHDAVGAAIAHERKGSNSYGDLYFSTRPNGGSVTERMRINSAGNVGIGSTSPAKTLTVDGTIGGTAFGIADGKALLVDGSPSDDQYARFTANGLEGRSVANLLRDLSLDS